MAAQSEPATAASATQWLYPDGISDDHISDDHISDGCISDDRISDGCISVTPASARTAQRTAVVDGTTKTDDWQSSISVMTG
jgi:hypothetical protein